jgi:glucan phosphoethanolaminetransferase (alkaline phosphatase superfamily)
MYDCPQGIREGPWLAQVEFMDCRSIKWTIFTLLSLTAPAMLFLVMAVMFMPAIFFVAAIGYMIPKAFSPGHTAETLSFIVIFGIHVLVYAGLYYAVSVLLAKVITMIKGRTVRNCVTAAFCLGFVFLTQFPVYGAGGHGPMRWYPLSKLLGDFNKSYGAGTVEIVYGAAILLLGGIGLFRKLKKNRS